jgi:hypothetical protein
MSSFAITPENRITVETLLLIAFCLVALFVAHPVRHSESAEPAGEMATGD